MRKPEIKEVRPASNNHQVVTLKGGEATYRRQPCDTCPWRVDAIGEFPAEAFRHSANTAYDMASNEFACHSSGKEKPAICAGFLLKGSEHNLTTRLKAARGDYDFKSVTDGGVELFDNYRDMAIANGVSENEEVLRSCR